VSRLNDNALSRIRNEKIGFVFQTFNLLPRLTALGNVRLPLLYAHERRSGETSVRALERVNLTARMHHRPNQLSGGQQQRVAIARALVMEPAIILADEPTGNLDTELAFEIMSLFREINKRGATVIICTHDRELIRHFGQKILFLYKGKLLRKEAL
jgi:putative ABC transport system ATP-binding protein